MGVGHVGRGNTAHIDIRVLMEFNPSRRFSHRITDVLVRLDGNRLELLSFAPMKEDEIRDIHVSRALCRGLRLYHEDGTRIIVHVEIRGAGEWEAQIRENGTHIEKLLTSVSRTDKFGLRARKRIRTLVACFVHDGGPGHDDDHAAN